MEARVVNNNYPIVAAVLNIFDFFPMDTELSILEIGCGEGGRLSWLMSNLNIKAYGVEPSLKAVKQAQSKGIVI